MRNTFRPSPHDASNLSPVYSVSESRLKCHIVTKQDMWRRPEGILSSSLETQRSLWLALKKEIVLAIVWCKLYHCFLPVAKLLWFYFVDDVKWRPGCLPKFGKACFLCYFLSSLFSCLCSQRRTVISQRIWDDMMIEAA